MTRSVAVHLMLSLLLLVCKEMTVHYRVTQMQLC